MAEEPPEWMADFMRIVEEKFDRLDERQGQLGSRLLLLESESRTPSTKGSAGSAPSWSDFLSPKSVSKPAAVGAARKAVVKPKRETRLSQWGKVADSSTMKTVVVHAMQPDYSHIRLHNLQPTNVLKFCKQVVNYGVTHNIRLDATALVSPRVRHELISRNRTLTEFSFGELSVEELFALLQQEIRPWNKLEFAELLSENTHLSLPGGFNLSTASFGQFYQKLQDYRQDFLQLYELIAEGAPFSIPKCNNKVGGLVRVFLSKLPSDYGQNCLASMDSDKFDSIHDFLDSFFILVEDQYRHFKDTQARELCYGNKQGRGSVAAAAQETPRRTSHTRRSGADISMIEPDVLGDSRGEAELPLGAEADERNESDAGEESAELPESEDSVPEDVIDDAIDGADSVEDLDERLRTLQMVTKTSKSALEGSRPVGGCFGKMLRGECSRKNCRYSHDPVVLSQAWKKLHDAMMTAPSKPESFVVKS